jgi:signal peptidase I
MSPKKHKESRKKHVIGIIAFLIFPLDFLLKFVNIRIRNIIKKIVLGFLTAIILYCLITLVIRFDRMPTNSMLDTIKKEQLVITSKLRYAITIPPFVSKLTKKTIVFSRPKRGDIVLIKNPRLKKKNFFVNITAYPIYFITLGKVNNLENNYIVKRIIGLPNESIEIKDKVIYINNEELNEPWLKTHNDRRVLDKDVSNRDNLDSYIVGYNQYFVLSDNRDYGYDSRDFGDVHFGLIKGKVISK